MTLSVPSADLRSVATPRRIQRSRAKGSKMLAGAVYVGRPSRWGNPFHVVKCMRYDRSVYWAVAIGEPHRHRQVSGEEHPREEDAVAEAVDLFVAWLHGEDWRIQYLRRCPNAAGYLEPLLTPPTFEEIRASLAGRHLACWCGLDCACHADELLAIANGPSVVEIPRYEEAA